MVCDDTAQPIEFVVKKEEAELLKKLLLELCPEHRNVITRRIGYGCEPKILREIGDELGITRERVRQIEGKGLGRLRFLVSKYQLENYF